MRLTMMQIDRFNEQPMEIYFISQKIEMNGGGALSL
jgi:hypothetical protein